MADAFIFMIWWWGAIADWEQKRGFWNRVFWIERVAEAIYFWAKNAEQLRQRKIKPTQPGDIQPKK